jgi:hypothetical protein
MSLTAAPLLLLCLVPSQDKPAPKFPVGKETTYVTGPLTREGYIDYETALNDRLAKGITPQRNANALLWMALGPTPEGGAGMPAEFFKRLGIEPPPKDGAYFMRLRAYLTEHLKLDESEIETVHDQQSRVSQRPWTAKDYPHLASWLKANEKPLAVVTRASQRPDYYNPLIARAGEKEPGLLLGALLPGVQKCRELATALTARAMLRLAEGKLEAWQDLLACHRLGRLVARGGTLIEGLVGIAIDHIASQADLAYIESARLTPRQIQDRLKDLRDLPPMPPLADKLDLTERFMYLDSVQVIRRGGAGALGGLLDRPGKKPDAKELQALELIDWEPALRNGNQYYNRLVAALRHKDRVERLKGLARIEDDLLGLKKEGGPENLAKLLQKDPLDKAIGKKIGDVLVTLFMPAAGRIHDAYDRVEQNQRNRHLAFALAAYQREHKAYPAKLDDLAPRYLPAVPNDIFSGKALIYRPSAKGYLLYSVGANGKDEEGRWSDDTPPGDDLRVNRRLARAACCHENASGRGRGSKQGRTQKGRSRCASRRAA